jgi:hypothetical protein
MLDLSELDDISPQDLAEVIVDMQAYRDRLLNETLEAAKKAKLMKSQVMTQLEPQLAEIDNTLQLLRDKQASLVAVN